MVGLTACISASLLQAVTYSTKMFPNLPVLPIPVVILAVVLVGGIVGWVNGFFVAKFQLHPYCNSCNAADRIRFFAYVHHDQRQ